MSDVKITEHGSAIHIEHPGGVRAYYLDPEEAAALEAHYRAKFAAEQPGDPGLFILNYDPNDSPIEHDILRFAPSGEWFKVGHGTPTKFEPLPEDVLTPLSLAAEQPATPTPSEVIDWIEQAASPIHYTKLNQGTFKVVVIDKARKHFASAAATPTPSTEQTQYAIRFHKVRDELQGFYYGHWSYVKFPSREDAERELAENPFWAPERVGAAASLVHRTCTEWVPALVSPVPEQPTLRHPRMDHDWPCPLFYTGNWREDRTPIRACTHEKGCPAMDRARDEQGGE